MNRPLLVLLLVIGLMLGVVFGLRLHAQDGGDDEGIIVKPYHPCDHLEPYSYFWYAFYCDLREEGEAVTAQSMTVEPDGTVTVEREYATGARRVFTGRKVK